MESFELFSINGGTRNQVNQEGEPSILVYARSHLRITRRQDLECPDIECLTLELNLRTQGKILLFFCYRPPDFPPDLFFSKLSDRLTQATDRSLLVVLGDLNAKHRLWDDNSVPNPAGTRAAALFDDFTLTQTVMSPTRFSPDGQSSSVLDLFAIDRPDLVVSTEVGDPISDHCYVTSTLSLRSPLPPKQTVTRFDYAHADWHGLRGTLNMTPLMLATSGTDNVDIAWSVWKEKLRECILRHIPIRTFTVRPRNKPWMTADLHRLSRKKHRLFKLASRTKLDSDWGNYTRVRNDCNREFEKAKRRHLTKVHSSIVEESTGSSTWWRKVKDLAKITTHASVIPDMEDGSTTATSPEAKANLFARFFASQCSDPHSSDTLPPGAPYPTRSADGTYDLHPVTDREVLNSLSKLSPSKSSGCPLLTNRVLREVAPSISQSLTYIFNLSLHSSTFPQDWKTAVVVPLYKQRGDASAPTNYRPVSLLPAVAKVLDAIQSKRLSSFLLKNKLLTDHQFGFLPGRSTTQQLVYVVDKWLQTQDKGSASVGVFLDFQKAFDKVWHKGLLFKLACCGVSPDALSWFESYLFDRAITVRVEGIYSKSHPISTGVPQGSHLGPILFAVFINDLTSAVQKSQTELYADDALIHKDISKDNIPQEMHSLQTSVSDASAWAQSWRGRFSPAKTVVLPLGNLATNACQQFPLSIDEENIDIVETHKHLGVILSTDLKWKAHLESILTKAP